MAAVEPTNNIRWIFGPCTKLRQMYGIHWENVETVCIYSIIEQRHSMKRPQRLFIFKYFSYSFCFSVKNKLLNNLQDALLQWGCKNTIIILFRMRRWNLKLEKINWVFTHIFKCHLSTFQYDSKFRIVRRR